jgi:hypothetical protein
MRCSNCGGSRLERAEYRTSELRAPAPAFQCARCHTLILDPSAASSDEERDSVRLAIAAQQAVILDLVEPTPRPKSPAPVE